MKIKLSSVMVDDRQKALKFYTEVLGFVKKNGSTGRKIQVANGRLARRSG
jgi:catechol 2,3-dioxygenase-like lactoylglutathione lyase family enzyme